MADHRRDNDSSTPRPQRRPKPMPPSHRRRLPTTTTSSPEPVCSRTQTVRVLATSTSATVSPTSRHLAIPELNAQTEIFDRSRFPRGTRYSFDELTQRVHRPAPRDARASTTAGVSAGGRLVGFRRCRRSPQPVAAGGRRSPATISARLAAQAAARCRRAGEPDQLDVLEDKARRAPELGPVMTSTGAITGHSAGVARRPCGGRDVIDAYITIAAGMPDGDSEAGDGVHRRERRDRR